MYILSEKSLSFLALNDREVSGVLKKNNLYFSDDQICAGSKIDKDAHYNLVFEYKTLYHDRDDIIHKM